MQGLTDRAIFAYEMAAALNPACAEALNNLGVLHRERGNLERASHCYTAALQIRPNFPQVPRRSLSHSDLDGCCFYHLSILHLITSPTATPRPCRFASTFPRCPTAPLC